MASECPSEEPGMTTSGAVIPDFNWMLGDWRRLLAFGFGSGLAQKAPGTVGTLVAIPIYWFLQLLFPWIVIFALTLPLFILGVWVCNKVSLDLGVEDHGGIVWDEIVAYLMVLSLVFNHHYQQDGHLSLGMVLIATFLSFGLFRFFDITKPFPIRRLEQKIPGGFGIMVDDVFAAIYTLIVFKLIWMLIRLI